MTKKKKQKLVKSKIYLGVWDHWFLLLQGCTFNEALNYVEKEYGAKIPPYEGKEHGGAIVSYASGHFLMWLADGVKLSTIMHECFHMTFHILERKGMTLSFESEEAFAYTQEFIFKAVLFALKKHKVRIKYE